MTGKLILASSSPRRRAILNQLGLVHIVHASGLKEQPVLGESPAATVERLALEKARAVQEFYRNDIILAADTAVVLDGEMLGKPKDRQDARNMLRRLQGRSHQVMTGVAVLSPAGEWSGVSITKVRMRSLSDEEIEAYVASGEPMDKAGAYAIQGLGASLIEEISGCFYNVVGLPVSLTIRLLRRAGYRAPNYALSETVDH